MNKSRCVNQFGHFYWERAFGVFFCSVNHEFMLDGYGRRYGGLNIKQTSQKVGIVLQILGDQWPPGSKQHWIWGELPCQSHCVYFHILRDFQVCIYTTGPTWLTLVSENFPSNTLFRKWFHSFFVGRKIVYEQKLHPFNINDCDGEMRFFSLIALNFLQAIVLAQTMRFSHRRVPLTPWGLHEPNDWYQWNSVISRILSNYLLSSTYVYKVMRYTFGLLFYQSSSGHRFQSCTIIATSCTYTADIVDYLLQETQA